MISMLLMTSFWPSPRLPGAIALTPTALADVAKVRVSLPLPPSMVSAPAPPTKVSLPAPPVSLSAPAPPVRLSLPPPAMITSAPPPPSTVSAPVVSSDPLRTRSLPPLRADASTSRVLALVAVLRVRL